MKSKMVIKTTEHILEQLSKHESELSELEAKKVIIEQRIKTLNRELTATHKINKLIRSEIGISETQIMSESMRLKLKELMGDENYLAWVTSEADKLGLNREKK